MPKANEILDNNDVSDNLYVNMYPSYIKNNFIKKVYTILSIQLIATVGIASIFTFNIYTRMWILSNPYIVPLNLLLSVFILCPLFAYKKNYPINLALLSAFTLSESILVSYICAQYYENGMGTLILYSIATTSFVFLSMTAYTCCTRQDFKFLEVGLSIGTIFLLGSGLVFLFIPTVGIEIFITAGGCILFCGYILYDTSEIMNYMEPDDAIVASVQLYLDIINLFLYILQCLRIFDND